MPERSIGVIDDFPTWHNVSPRFGLAYDLTGDGRTAVKFAIGRYVEQEATGYSGEVQYVWAHQAPKSRSWTDLNGDDIAQDNEIGPTSNVNFGLPSDQRNADPDFSRQTNYSINVNLEHELHPGLSVSGGYYYRKYTNFGIRDNVVTTRADYLSGFAADPRDNGQTVEVFWLDPTLVGQVSRLDINTENWWSYNGFDINLSARFGDGGVVTSGFQAGKLVKNDCEQEDPNGSTHGFRPFFASGGPFCDQTQFDIPFDKTFKLSGAYPLPVPGNIQVSGVFQSVPGDIRTLTGSVTRGEHPAGGLPEGVRHHPVQQARRGVSGPAQPARPQVQRDHSVWGRTDSAGVRHLQRVERGHHPGAEQQLRRVARQHYGDHRRTGDASGCEHHLLGNVGRGLSRAGSIVGRGFGPALFLWGTTAAGGPRSRRSEPSKVVTIVCRGTATALVQAERFAKRD